MYAIKNPRDLPKTGLVTAISHTIVGFLTVAVAYGAMYLVATGKIQPFAAADSAIYVFADYIGIGAQILVYAAILAAALSSASLFLSASSTLLSKDLTAALGINIKLEKQIAVSRIFMIVLGAIAIVVSIYNTSLVAILGTFGWGTLTSATFPVFILGLLWERANEKGVLCGIATSFVLNLVSLPIFGVRWPNALPGYFNVCAISIAVAVIVSLVTKKQALAPGMKEVLEL
jgi:Na+/proline symporter